MIDKQIKSVHITNYYHKTSGGISTAYDRLLEAANRHRRFVRLIVPGEDHAQEEVGEFGRIYYVKAASSPVFDRRYRLLLPFHYVQSETPIRRILRSEMPDIIEIGEKYTLSLLAGIIRKGYFKALDRPMLVHLSSERMDDNLRAFISDARFFRWLSRRLISNYIFPMFDYHLANSDYTAREIFDAVDPRENPRRSKSFLNFCWRYFRASDLSPQERVFVNNCGVDKYPFDSQRRNPKTREALLKKAGFPQNATVLLYAGRISPEKNVQLLAEVFKSLVEVDGRDSTGREYRFLVVGDGPQRERLEKQFHRFVPGTFAFLGHISDKESLADIYANSDIFLHPNPREPFGIAPLEAMASGLPVLAPDSGGIVSYATEQNAWLVKPAVDEYVSAIRKIVGDDRNRRARVERAIQTAERLTWENSNDNLFALYDKMYEDFVRRHDRHVYSQKDRKLNFQQTIAAFSPPGDGGGT